MHTKEILTEGWFDNIKKGIQGAVAGYAQAKNRREGEAVIDDEARNVFKTWQRSAPQVGAKLTDKHALDRFLAQYGGKEVPTSNAQPSTPAEVLSYIKDFLISTNKVVGSKTASPVGSTNKVTPSVTKRGSTVIVSGITNDERVFKRGKGGIWYEYANATAGARPTQKFDPSDADDAQAIENLNKWVVKLRASVSAPL